MADSLRKTGLTLAVFAVVLNIVIILVLSIRCPNGLSLNGRANLVVYYFPLLCTLLVLLAMILRLTDRAEALTPARRIAVVRTVVVIGFVAAIVYHFAQWVWFGHGYPSNTFLFRPEDRFMDYLNIVQDSAGLNPFARLGGYLPFGYFIGYLLSYFEPYLVGFVLSMLFFTACLLYYGLRRLTASGQHFTAAFFSVAAITLLSYPFLFVVDRGNFDFLMCLFLVLFFIFLERHAERAAAFVLGLSIAMKAYSLVYALLFVQQKRYRAALLTAVTAVGVNVLSLALFKGGLFLNTRHLFTAFHSSVNNGVFNNALYIRFSSSLYTFLVVSAAPWFPRLHANAVFFNYYNGCALLLLLALIGYLLKYERVHWRQVTLLTIALILLPFTSGDYRMVFLFLPLWMYLSTSETSRFDSYYVVLFSLLLIPKNYGILTGEQNIAMLLNPMLLVVLTITLLKHNHEERSRQTHPLPDDRSWSTETILAMNRCPPSRK